MRNAQRFLLCLVSAVGVAAAADEPWRSKPYQQWDEKDIRRVMNDSPWARQVSVAVGVQARAPQAPSAQPSGPYATEGQPGQTVPTAPSPGISPAGEEAPRATFLVRWSSAATVRQAMIRSAVLRGTMTAEEGEKYLEHRATEYEILVSGESMEPFARTDEFLLKQKSYLRLKSSKQKLPPTRVTFERADDGKTLRRVVFRFAKTTEAGEVAIPASEKNVEFFCPAGPVSIQTTFDLRKMVGKEGADL